jgi:hypothetical protein
MPSSRKRGERGRKRKINRKQKRNTEIKGED